MHMYHPVHAGHLYVVDNGHEEANGAVHVVDIATGRCVRSIESCRHLWSRPNSLTIMAGSIYLTEGPSVEDEEDEDEDEHVNRGDEDMQKDTIFQMSLIGEPRPHLRLERYCNETALFLSGHAGQIFASCYDNTQVFVLYKHCQDAPPGGQATGT